MWTSLHSRKIFGNHTVFNEPNILGENKYLFLGTASCRAIYPECLFQETSVKHIDDCFANSTVAVFNGERKDFDSYAVFNEVNHCYARRGQVSSIIQSGHLTIQLGKGNAETCRGESGDVLCKKKMSRWFKKNSSYSLLVSF